MMAVMIASKGHYELIIIFWLAVSVTNELILIIKDIGTCKPLLLCSKPPIYIAVIDVCMPATQYMS